MALDPSEYNVDDLREKVTEIDDPEELEAALEAEREDEDRKTAKRAFRRRIEQIEKQRNLRVKAAEDASRASERVEERLLGSS